MKISLKSVYIRILASIESIMDSSSTTLLPVPLRTDNRDSYNNNKNIHWIKQTTDTEVLERQWLTGNT